MSRRSPVRRSNRSFFSSLNPFSRPVDRAMDFKRSGLGYYRGLRIEQLEDRRLLAVDLVGVPDWVDQGSSPMISTSSIVSPLNASSGGVEQIAVDPNNPARIFLGTVNGGIWRTTTGDVPFNGIDDNGVAGIDDPTEQPDWEPLTDDYPSLAIGDIQFDPLDPAGNTIFAGTGSASSLANAGGRPIGVMRSTDGGDTWEIFPVNPGGTEPQNRVVLPTVFDGDNATPGVQQVVLVGAVGTAGGVYRSIDGGETYTQISGSNGLPAGPVTQIAADPNNAAQYFAGVVGQGVYRSTDGGLNWAAVNTSLTNLATSSVIQVAAHPNGGTTRLYALISGFTGSNGAMTLAAVRTVVFTSTNGGNTWTQLAAVPAGFDGSRPDLYTSLATDQLVIDPSNSQIVYIAKGFGGSPILYRYNPGGGGGWTLIDSGGTAGGTRPHVDSRDLKFIGNNILLHANDGGIFAMQNPQAAAASNWTSFHGIGATSLGITEYHNLAYDSTFDVAIGGAQDNGTSVQNGAGNIVWTQFQGSDGGDVAVDTVNAGAGQTFRYASTQNFGVLNRFVFNSATNIVGAAIDLFPAAGLANFNPPFVPHFELNTADLTRLVTGGGGSSSVYELLNAATAANAGAANWQAVPLGAGFGSVNRGTLVYGGRMGGADNAEVLIAGSGSGVYLRSTAGGTLTVTSTAFPGGTVQDIAVDPENWQHFFVTDSAGVWETTDAGNSWNDLSSNLGLINTRLNSLGFIPTAGLGALVVGGNLGSSKLLLDNLAAGWTRFGAGLPNAVVDELVYNPEDDVLLAGTFGRGAYLIDNASLVVEDEGILNICGDEDHVNQDDVITLIRNAMNPLVLDVFLNSVAPVFSVALALIEQINVFGVGGNDTLIVDSSNGLINVPNGIRFDGDGACPGEPLGAGYDRGIDTLQLMQTGGVTYDTDTLTVGATVGQGISTIVGAGVGNVQTVYFEELEPVVDNVPAVDFIVNGNAIGSLLNGANQITYDQSSLLGLSWGRVTVDAFEPIYFSNKTSLTIDAENGDDTIVADNDFVTTGLESLIFNGGAGNDTIRFDNLPDASATSFVGAAAFGGSGDDVIDGSGVNVATPLTLDGESGNDTLTGGAGADDLNGGGDDDTIIDSLGDDIIDGGLFGNDTFIVRGTFGSDLISVLQDAPSNVANGPYVLTVTGPTAGNKQVAGTLGGATPDNPANRPNIERIVVEGLAGDDAIRVGHADEYGDNDGTNGNVAQTIAFEVRGGSPNASDRLVVPDLGLGDLVIQRQGADQRSGSVVVAGMAPIDYSEIEFVNVTPLNPITAGTGTDGAGRLVVFKNDPFESNNTLPNATFLGAGPTINVDPTIDPGGIPAFGVPGDNDFYQFVAQETGTLDLQIYFEVIDTLANGRAGLPVGGELVATVLDSDGIGIVPIPTASDLLDPVGNKIGERITVPVVRNNTYYLRVEGQAGDEGASGINVYSFTAITTPAPIPELVDLQADSDSGRHNGDDITKITTPIFDIILDDDRIDEFMNINLNPDTVDDDAQTLNDAGANRIDYGVEVFNNAVSIGFAFYTGAGNTWQFTATVGDLNEGDFNHISAAVWIRDAAVPAQIGRHELSPSLQVTLDTINPPVSFGLNNALNAEDGLAADSDTGVVTMPMTFADRVTSDTTPRLWGRAEADTIVSVYLDRDDDGVIDLLTDTFLGQTVATPLDGNNAFPDGYWELVSALDLNQIVGLPKDGVRRLLVSAEDVAGNPMPMNNEIDVLDELNIFIDTQGPQVYDPVGDTQAVHPTNLPEYDLFDPKPSVNGFTPLVNQITINVRDLPVRSNVDANFLYDALKEDIAETVGNYMLVGDHVGTIGIIDVDVVNAVVLDGQQATATVTLTFADFLPDDRYTLTVNDNLVDPAGNNLDGESNASGPLDDPIFPSGDGVPGGDFVARFTIDSRPEIGSFIPTTISIDINGNFVWDPANGQIGNDATNVDLIFAMDREGALPGGFATHDTVFAGRFVGDDIGGGGFGGGGGGFMPGDRLFDQLAVYGFSFETGEHRWLIDFDSDGVANQYTSQPLLANFNVVGALPVAGNFDNNAANGDEIGLYYAGTWALDTNHNFVIDAGDTFVSNNLLGLPIVGDFDGDGMDDLAIFNNNFFQFDLANDGFFGSNAQFQWGFSGVLERPVAADMDQDGIDDIGLWVPRNSTQPLRQTAEWFFLLSGFPDQVTGSVGSLTHAFEPVPFGNDLFAEFGDELALPIVGNFDPPVAASTTPNTQDALAGDYDGSGTVDQADYAAWKASFGQTGNGLAADGNGDGIVNAADMTIWRDNLGATNELQATAPELAGDYDGSGFVDQNDYATWKASFGQTGNGLAADGNGNGIVDAADMTIWRDNLGASSTSSLLVASGGGSSLVVAPPANLSAIAPVSNSVAIEAAFILDEPANESEAEVLTVEGVDAIFADSSNDLLLLSDRIVLEEEGEAIDFELLELAAEEESADEEAFAVL